MSTLLKRLSPYLVLGLDYAAPIEAAREAFARRARYVRRSANSPFTLEDLTWALREVERLADNPDGSVEYFRVPANRASFPQPREGDLLQPAPMPLERRSPRPSSDDERLVARLIVEELMREVLRGATALAFVEPYEH